MALTAAETGHLVFGTLHTNSAPKTIDRIIDVFPDQQQVQVRTMLAESLKGVIAQKFFKTVQGNGRVAAFEILINTSAISNLIREKKTFQIESTMQIGTHLGMTTMERSIDELVKKNIIAGVAENTPKQDHHRQAQTNEPPHGNRSMPPPPRPHLQPNKPKGLDEDFKITSTTSLGHKNRIPSIGWKKKSG